MEKRRIKKERIGLFGGTFNPIHLGHLKMAEEARKKFKLDMVYFIPNGNPPHRKKDILPAKKRYELVKNAIKGNKHFKVLDIEIKKKKPSYTVDTVKELISLPLSPLPPFPRLFFLIGQDAFEELDTWRGVDELVKLVEFIVFPRIPDHVIARSSSDEAISKTNLKKRKLDCHALLCSARNDEYQIPKIKNLQWKVLKAKPINISGEKIRKSLKLIPSP